MVKRIGDQREEEISQLLETVQSLPLAVAQAAAYMQVEKCTLSTYLQHYQMHQADMLSHHLLPEEPMNKTVTTTFTLSMGHILLRYPEADHILSIGAYLAAEDIPIELLRDGTEIDGEKITEAQMIEIIRYLDNYSLLTYQAEQAEVSLHRLFQTVIRLNHQRRENSDYWFVKVLGILANRFAYDKKDQESINKVQRLIPHGLHFTDLVDNATATIPIAELLIKIGDHQLYAKGKYKIAKFCYERALIIQGRAYGRDHIKVAETLVSLGDAYRGLGGAKKSKELLERALVILELEYGIDHVAVARTLYILGNAYGDLGNRRKSKERLERALAIFEREYDPDHIVVVRTLTKLACVDVTDNPRKNIELLERALAIEEREYGRDHIEVASILGNLGNAYNLLGNQQKSKERLERALMILEREYGRNHIEVAKALESLGIAYGDFSDLQKNKERLERALAIKEREYGRNHIEVAETLGSLGAVYGFLRNPQKMKELLERALVIKEWEYGIDHVDVAKAKFNLAVAYIALGNIDTAYRYAGQAKTIYSNHYPSSHPSVQQVQSVLTRCEELRQMQQRTRLSSWR